MEDIMKRFMIAAFLFIFLPGLVCAQDFTGTYDTQHEGETVTLHLTQDADGKVTGNMRSEGIEYMIKGHVKGDRITGLMNASDESFKDKVALQFADHLEKIAQTSAPDAKKRRLEVAESFRNQFMAGGDYVVVHAVKPL
jgi:hypothetical protein